MPKVSEEHAERRRTQILEAAAECFARKGIHRTTMQDIFAATKLSPGSVYTWFPSKKSIIDEMMRRRLATFEAARAQAKRDPAAAIEAYLDTIRRAADVSAVGWMNIHLVSESVRDAHVRDIMRQVVSGGVEVLEQALAGLPAIGPEQATERARLLQAALYGIVIQRLISPEDAADFDLAAALIMG